ncbi:DUF937 domain-containing protein [Deinococcus aquiradiocola]|uniref:DUF937 domain-containing protein n=1 Tax=Deinococcus aquiradiocola TaxID=393059 RepID=A0A917PLI7_9DEIO|nr:DUF937 domain-containing protein [Deinococcus aquiradiocola]GGJ83250.1 hypothetical protein GCM10008939_28920 [Deinococcus aquiradiocola]
MNVLDMLGGLLPTQASSVASQVGATPEQTQAAMQASIPLILSALNHNAQSPDGEAALSSALQQHDGSSLDGFAQGQLPNTQDGAAILNHAFGAQTPAAANAVAQHAGIDPQMAMQILSIVAPLVLGALGRTQNQGGAAGGLGDLLGGLLGGAGGSSMGGLGGLLGGLLGGGNTQAQTQNQSSQPDLGGLLGSLLGGKK